MAGHSTTTAVVGAGIAATAGGPLSDVFNEMALVMALMGGFGGMARGLALMLPWRAVGRGLALGALLSAGLGVLLPLVLSPWIGPDAAPSPSLLAACAFLAGFLQDRVVSKLRDGGKNE